MAGGFERAPPSAHSRSNPLPSEREQDPEIDGISLPRLGDILWQRRSDLSVIIKVLNPLNLSLLKKIILGVGLIYQAKL